MPLVPLVPLVGTAAVDGGFQLRFSVAVANGSCDCRFNRGFKSRCFDRRFNRRFNRRFKSRFKSRRSGGRELAAVDARTPAKLDDFLTASHAASRSWTQLAARDGRRGPRTRTGE